MSIEQVGRDFVLKMNDPDKLMSYITADAVADGGVLPQPMKLVETLPIVKALMTAMPDIKYDIREVKVKGNQATVNVIWTGTQTGTLGLPMPGLPAIPPTGKKVSVKDSYVVTVEGDKVSRFTVQSPADGGIPAALKQLGVTLPPM